MLAIRLPAEIEERLEALARRTGRTKTYYAREAILDHIEELEDTYLAAERLKKPARRWTQSDLERELDLEH
ncbi:MAG: TraY domain-containing protein [Candidatus Binatia bacterium]